MYLKSGLKAWLSLFMPGRPNKPTVQLPPNSNGKTQVLAQSAADVKNHLLASLS